MRPAPLFELDAAELPDEPEELWQLFDLLNIACGGHAGDQASMARALAACKRHGIAAGAHPSYPDRDGFGRRTLAMLPSEVEASVITQCDALLRATRLTGIDAITHLKPHGALYHDAARDRALADAVIRGARQRLGDVIVIGPPTGELAAASRVAGLRYLREGFADRGTRPDGSLIPRGESGALITDPEAAATRARALVGQVDALCVHADTPGALAIASAVRAALTSATGIGASHNV